MLYLLANEINGVYHFRLVVAELRYLFLQTQSQGLPVRRRLRRVRRLAGALAQTARLTDTIARYGGEEFVILLPHTTSDESQIVGDRLRAILARSDWPKRRVTASIGLATINEQIKDADALVRAADDALRFAKAHGRDQVIHWDQLHHVSKSS